jgi:hypothetical protein
VTVAVPAPWTVTFALSVSFLPASLNPIARTYLYGWPEAITAAGGNRMPPDGLDTDPPLICFSGSVIDPSEWKM